MDKTINEILLLALLEIREQHKVALDSISVQWVSTTDDSATYVSEVYIQGRAVK